MSLLHQVPKLMTRVVQSNWSMQLYI